MGVGDPLEASYTAPLDFDLPAAPWHLTGDGIVLAPVDLTFDLLLRRASTADRPLATFTHHFDPPSGSNDAVPYEADAPGAAASLVAGDAIVLRLTAAGKPGPSFIPNADGTHTNGRIPSVKLP